VDRNPPWYLSDLNILNGSDSACIIKRYAYIVDKLYSRGLDLHSKLKRGYRNNSILWYDMKGQESQKKKYDKTDLFINFVEHKEVYEYRYYHKKDDSRYAAYVENLIRYGGFSHPKDVRDVLLFKYKNLTKEKLYKDIREPRRGK